MELELKLLNESHHSFYKLYYMHECFTCLLVIAGKGQVFLYSFKCVNETCQ